MKVLHVIDSLILAGVEVLLREMLPLMRDQRIDSSVVVLKHLDSPLENALRLEEFPFLPSRGSEIYSPLHVWSLAGHIGSFDVVHSYLFPAQLWVVAAAKLAGKRVQLVTTEQSTQNRRRRPWARPLDRWMYRNYAAIACNSEATRKNLLEWVPEVSDRINVVYNGVPLERFRDAVAANKEGILPNSNGRPVVMFVARFDPAKDHPTLLRAMRQVRNADLVLVGDGDLRPQLQRLAQELEIGERVHFLGRRPDIPQLLKMADLYVHASNFEGFGIAAVEAMSAGLPVVASDVPGLGEIVKGAGILVPPGDEDALAKAINDVLQSQTLREQLAAASRKRAADFSIGRTVDAFIEIYQSVTRANH
jgi:glycosyltransferase involved in cell wall biosynthesis